MRVLEDGISGIFNVGTGKETSVNQLFRTLVEITGAHAKENYGPERRGEQIRSNLDWTRLKKATEWEPRMDLREGLERVVAYFRSMQKN